MQQKQNQQHEINKIIKNKNQQDKTNNRNQQNKINKIKQQIKPTK